MVTKPISLIENSSKYDSKEYEAHLEAVHENIGEGRADDAGGMAPHPNEVAMRMVNEMISSLELIGKVKYDDFWIWYKSDKYSDRYKNNISVKEKEFLDKLSSEIIEKYRDNIELMNETRSKMISELYKDSYRLQMNQLTTDSLVNKNGKYIFENGFWIWKE